MESKKSVNITGIVVVVVVLLIGAVAFAQSRAHKDAMMKDDTMHTDEAMVQDDTMKDDSMMKQDTTDDNMMMKKDDSKMSEDSMMMSKGTYEAYTPEKLTWAKDGKVVLFFKASWCPTCTAVDADIRAHLSSIPEGTHILTVDYDTAAALKKQYGVTYQHTFVQVDSAGMALAKWSGSPTLTALLTQIK